MSIILKYKIWYVDAICTICDLIASFVHFDRFRRCLSFCICMYRCLLFEDALLFLFVDFLSR